jgi:xylan 1,4-beta-xylosidase
MIKRKRLRNMLVLFAVGSSSLLRPAFAANYTLTVNAGLKQGTWNRFYERAVACDHMNTVINSVYGRNISNALKKGHDEAGFQYVRGHGILDSDVNVYTEDANGNAVYNWTNFDKIEDSIKAAGMKPIVEIGFMPPALAGSPVSGVTGATISGVWYNGVPGNWCPPKDWNKWEALVKALLAHCETRYGQAEVRSNWFFELWNEPNWMYSGGGGYTGWKTLYQHTATAFKAQDALARLGGPAESGGSSNSAVPDFMSWTKANAIKADFCSYHIYANDPGPTYACNTGEPFSFYRDVVLAAAKSNSFTGLLLNTEWGPSYTAGDTLAHDAEIEASFAAKAIHLFNLADTTTCPPPYSLAWWALSDIYEEVDNRGASPAFCGCYGLLCRGVPSIPQSWDIAKPSFNAFKLLHRLKDYKISCTGGTTASPGVNVIGTISAANDTICVMVYSHVDNTSGNASTADNVTLNITMPSGWTSARMEHWVIDQTHSNSYRAWRGLGSPLNPTADQWTTIAVAANLAHYDSVATVTFSGGVYSKTFTQKYYSVGLIQLTNPMVGILNRTNSLYNFQKTVKTRFTNNQVILDVGIAGKYDISLYSVNGQHVKTVHAYGPGAEAISLRNLSAGTYLLECTGQFGRIAQKIMVGNGD